MTAYQIYRIYRTLRSPRAEIRFARRLVGGSFAFYSAWQAWKRKRYFMNFQNRVVLVTGGSRGLGFILAKRFLDQGAKVAICARNVQELEKASRLLAQNHSHLDIYAVVCDLAKAQDVEKMVRSIFDHYGRLDVLVNNAGIIEVGPLETLSIEDFENTMRINFYGAMYTTLNALNFGVKRIVNITSIGGTVAVPHLASYTASKFAFFGFSQALRIELSRRGIRVVTIVPGLMRTGSFRRAIMKGSRAKEFTWFSLCSTLPFFSMNAERAARQIVSAAHEAKSLVTLGMPAKFLRIVHALVPNTSLKLLGLVNRALPKAPPHENDKFNKIAA